MTSQLMGGNYIFVNGTQTAIGSGNTFTIPNIGQDYEIDVEFVPILPEITTHPESQNLLLGQTLTLTVVATGANLTYQ